MRIAWLLALVALPASADVSVLVSSYSASTGEFSITIAGDVAAVRLDVTALQLDWCKPGGELGTTATPTSPNLGIPNGDGVSSPFVTLQGPVTTICDLDPNQAWPGVDATVNGVRKPLVVGTAAIFGATAPPEPPTDPVLGTATLTWTPPTLNTDGSPVVLTGFRVYWGTTQGSYPNSASIANPGVTSYVVGMLAPGTWYFVVTALSAGGESAFSNVASKVIPPDQPPPPVDPCVADPLTFSVQTWPSATTGRRTLSYTTNKQATVTHAWGPQRASAVDARGCAKTVTR